MTSTAPIPIQSTAGAIPVINDKGEVSMQKVKVHRYVSGKRPEYAPESSSGEETDEEFPFDRRKQTASPEPVDDKTELDADDPRIRRLQQREIDVNVEERIERHRHIHAPEIISAVEEDEFVERPTRFRDDEESSEDEELDDEQIEARRAVIRMKMKARMEEEEIMNVEDEQKSEAEMSEEEEEESEYEEYTDSEEEMGPRLKPVFVRKKDRITIQEKERQLQKEKEWELEAKKLAEDRRKHTLKIVEEEAKKELMEKNGVTDPSELLDSGDENDEAEYEGWKLRELKRIKRDRDEREQREKERLEIERIHTMTEEERRIELRANPRVITNKATKGKYKFLQKYYHRGVFFMDEDDTVYKRDFAQPTLEDHFNKTILPKVMQVKNFGRSGRTKYTHLVDQDTTQFDSPWAQENAQNLKFHANQSGGMKQVFDKPSAKKRNK